ncbi:MAG: hypothetical protein WCV59_01530 [Parcubacteria group bacterium]|jgi:hypothetical protein
MEKIPASLTGKITSFEDDKKIIAIVATKYGEAYLDINVSFPNLKVGDEIDLEDADIYITDGRIIYVLPDEGWMFINNYRVEWKRCN